MENINSKILDVKNLRISFKTINGTVKAVRGIDFQLYRGRTLAIVGESGSGKSVTSRAVMGILAGNKIVEEGEILYGDQDLLQISEEDYCKIRGSKISMIFQDPLSSLNPIQKVGKQVTESMKLKRKATKKEAKRDSKKALGIIRGFIQQHPDCGFTEAQVNEFVEMFENKDNANLVFNLNKFDRITRDNVTTYQKTIQAVVNDEKKKSLEQKLETYSATRAKKREVLQAELDEFNKKIALENKDYSKYDIEPLTKLSVSLHNDYYKGLMEKCEKNGKALADFYATFSQLEGQEYIEAVAKNLKAMSAFVFDCQNELALEKDEFVFTFAVSLKHYLKEYKEAVKREKNAAKLAAKNEKKKAKGQSTDLSAKQKAWGSEIDTSSASKIAKIKSSLSDSIETLQTTYIDDLKEAMKAKNVEVAAKRYAEALRTDVIEYSHPIQNEEFVERAINLLGEVGIPEPEKRIKQYPFEFSGGMRQRIVIAIALSSNPEILICDEPTTALDVTIQAQILELINDLKRKRNLSIIFITHNLGVVANMADDIAVMYAGKIVEYGTVDEIFYEPKHPYTWALLASMPDLETKTKLDAIPGTPPNMIIPPKGDAFAARNKYAMKIDFEQEPPHYYVSATHWAATWLLAKGAPKVEAPLIVTERIKRMKKLNHISTSEGGK